MLVNCKAQKFIQKRDNINNAYLSDIRKFPKLSKEEEWELLKTYKESKNPKEKEAARQKLIEGNLRFVVSVARKFGTSETLLDIINEGNLGLIKAIENFDIKKNSRCRLITYAVSWIVVFIKDYQLKKMPMVAVPNIQKLVSCIKNVENDMIFDNERDVLPEELMDKINNKYKFQISNVEDVCLSQVVSIEEKYSSSNDEDNTYTSSYYEYTEKTKSNNIQDGINSEYKKRQTDFFLGKLNERESFIVKNYLGIGCVAETFETIALELNLCKEAIRQIYLSAIKKMQKYKEQSITLK